MLVINMLHFEGDQNYPQAPAEVWAKLRDVHFVAQCISGVESVSQAEAGTLVCTLRPGFSFVRGTLNLTLRVTEVEPGTSLRYHAHGKGIGSSNTVEAVLTLAPHDGGTRLHWSADVTELGGLLKAVPKGLIQAAAQKVIADTWTAVEGKLKG